MKGVCKKKNWGDPHTLRIVLRARVVSFTRTFSPRASEKRRLVWMLGSHDRRVFFFENGTLFPYCLVFPWKRPSCDRLKGWLSAAAKDGKDGNMGVAEGGGFRLLSEGQDSLSIRVRLAARHAPSPPGEALVRVRTAARRATEVPK